MKFTEKWLREWVHPDLSPEQLAAQLTMAGLEVDSVTKLADDFSGVVVGQIKACAKHPNADKLSVCKIDIGEKELYPVVCGGDNVRVGLKIALATVGAVLPGDFKIKKSKLRGEPSHGMICSARELGIQDANATPKGIMELADDAPLGVDLRDYLQLDDCVFDIELTPNRGDCASVKGIACEVGVLNHIPVQSVALTPVPASQKQVIPVSVEQSKACPRYAGRVIRGINAKAPTPMWMAARLEQAGIRCIHPVVDVCHYVMLELGQPMHGFDLDKLTMPLCVRAAQKGETLTLLDEREVVLDTTDLVIADANAAQALAGIMGGRDSGVSESTHDVFLESAFFDPITISLTARRVGVSSDSSYRFERGVDYTLPVPALERATRLLLEIAGGQPGPIIEITDKNTLPCAAPIHLRRKRIVSLLGIEISDQQVSQILSELGMAVKTDALGWWVTAPAKRFDIRHEVDLIEEIARIVGYDTIPTRYLEAPLKITTPCDKNIAQRRIADALVDRGYHEVVTYSFVDDSVQQLICPQLKAVAIQNPIASDMNVMRTSLLPGLLQAMLYNQNRQMTRQKLFELGLCFHYSDEDIIQEPYLGVAALGDYALEQWALSARPIDFFDLKGELEMLIQLTHSQRLVYEPGTHEALHPGKSADLYCGDECVGFLGVLHPKLVKQLGLRQAPVVMQVKQSALKTTEKTHFENISKFPSVRRDLALLVDEAVSASALLQLVKDKSDNTLYKAQIFDLYQGDGIEKGKKSVALGLTFQDPSRTLIEADINSVIQSIINALREDLKATLRT